jgi:hypothetical protein
VQRPLLLFLARLDGGDETGLLGGTKQRWVLVDWTDPTDSRFRGTYEGTGETAEEAIRGALSAWDWGNRYPAGHLTCDIPRTALGRRRQLRHEMETDGKTFGDEVRGVLEWIAVGGMVVAGVVLLFTPFQPVAAGALAVSVLSSTGAATIAIYDRHSQGIFDWRADVIDGLTIVGNLFAAGAAGAAPRWLRGARVRGMFEDGADRIFFGALIGVDLIQGILVADSLADELEALTKDGELSPEERHRKLMELLRSGAAATAITYISLRASVRAMANRDRKASAFTGDDRTRPIDEKLADLPNPDRGTPDRAIDVSRPPAAEGHTDKPQHATRGETGGSHHAKLISPAETELATSYPRDSHPWRKHYIDDSLIELVDKDGFTFKAECTDGSLSVTIVTNVDPATTDPDLMQYFRWAKKKEYSTVFWAKDLFRRMYDHFEQVGNPVKRLEGTWAWDNYAVAKAKYDELRGPPRRLSPKEAAKLAVLEAKTYVTYHRPRGFTKVVYAEHIPSIRQFAFRIEYEAPPQ